MVKETNSLYEIFEIFTFWNFHKCCDVIKDNACDPKLSSFLLFLFNVSEISIFFIFFKNLKPMTLKY